MQEAQVVVWKTVTDIDEDVLDLKSAFVLEKPYFLRKQPFFVISKLCSSVVLANA